MMPKSAGMFYRQAQPQRLVRGHGPLLRAPVIKFPFYANSELDDE
jgi:hypothetical protein